MEFIANVNITLKDYEDLKRDREKLNKIKDDINKIYDSKLGENFGELNCKIDIELLKAFLSETNSKYDHRKITYSVKE